jgi:peptidase A4-like protein
MKARIPQEVLVAAFACLAVSPALAQISSEPVSPSTTAPMSTRQHPPMRLVTDFSDGTVTTENWSGYAVTGSEFTFAKGSWHVPQVDCTKTPNTYSAFWVGIDGYSDSTVEQTGTASDCVGTTPNYYAWYEFYPAGSVVISMPVKPGDVMGGSVTYSNGEFTIGLHDHTTGAEFSVTKAVSGAKRQSAEWIAEAPCCTSGGSILPLADFVRANYGEDNNSDPGTNYATDSAVKDGPISAFGSKVEEITMESGSLKEAAPTALSSDGTSFSVYWDAE